MPEPHSPARAAGTRARDEDADPLYKELRTVRTRGLGPGVSSLPLAQLSALAQAVCPHLEDADERIRCALRRAAARLGGEYANAIADYWGLADTYGKTIEQRHLAAIARTGRGPSGFDKYVRAAMTKDLATSLRMLANTRETEPAAADPPPATEAQTRSSALAEPSSPAAARNLPAALWFSGRRRDLASLSDAFASRDPATMTLSIITATGGMGKTSLARQWAALNSQLFPDGVLHLDLHGFHPSMSPLSPDVALRILLELLGSDPATLTGDLDELIALYRTRTNGRRLLVLADNARDSAQVEPLIPAGRNCMMIVTSRHHLPAIRLHRAHLLALDPLDDDEARELLTQHIGADRVNAEPAATDLILACCAGLPLALCIVAGRARQKPTFPLASFAAQLRQTSERLDALDDDEPSASLRTVISWSDSLLPADTASAFRLLGVAPGTDIGTAAAAALLERPIRETTATLRRLENASLIQQPTPGRFQLHDLIRLYAIEQATSLNNGLAAQAAVRRLCGFYLASAYSGDRLLAEYRRSITLSPLAASASAHGLHDEAAAMTWFAAEHENLIAVQTEAARRAWHEPVWQLAWALDNYHWRTGHIHDDLDTWQRGLTAAHALWDRSVEGLAHRRLGRAYGRAANRAAAVDHTQRAISLTAAVGDTPGEAHSHRILAWLYEIAGNHEHAMIEAQTAVTMYEAIANPVWTAHAFYVLGNCCSNALDHRNAQEYWARALALHRHHHHAAGEAETLVAMATAGHAAKDHTAAVNLYDEALAIYARLGNSYDQATTLEHLGHTYTALNEHDKAAVAWQHALDLYISHRRTADMQRVKVLLQANPQHRQATQSHC